MRIMIVAVVLLATCLTGCMRFIPLGRSSTYVPPSIDTVKSPTVDLAALRAAYPHERGVMLGTRVEDYESVVRGADNYFYVRSMRYVILDAKADDLTNVSEQFHSMVGVRNADVLVFHPDGTREQYGLSDFTVSKVSEFWRVYRLPIKNATAGTVVDLCWVLEAGNSQNLADVEPTYLRHLIPTLRQEITLRRSSSFVPMQRKMPEIEGLNLVHSTSPNTTRYLVGEQPAIRDEKFSPPVSYQRARLDVCNRWDGATGYTPAQYWENQRDWMFWRHFNDDADDLAEDEQFQAFVASVLRGAQSRLDTLQRLKSWFSTNIKIDYNIESRETAESVFDERVGPIGGATTLARQMYRTAGWNVRIVQLHSSTKGLFDSTYTNYLEFREVGLVVWKDSTRYLVLIQRPLQPVNVVPSEYVGQPLLYVDTSEPGASIENGVVFFSDTTSIERQIRVELDEDGTARVEIVVSYTGEEAYDERSLLDELPESELTASLSRRFSPGIAEVSGMKVSAENLFDPALPLVLRASYVVASAANEVDGEMVFQTAGILSSISETHNGEDSTERQQPIVIIHPYRYNRRVEVRYPAAWTLRSTIDERAVHSDLGEMQRTRELDRGVMRVQFVSALHPGTYPQQLAVDLASVVGTSESVSIPTLVFATHR